MVSSSWFQILPIGQRMVISLLLFSPLTTASAMGESASSSSASATESQISSNKSPLLGIFTRNSKGITRLYCNKKNLDSQLKIIYLTKDGITGFVQDTKPIPQEERVVDAKENKIVPGEFIDNMNNGEIYLYSGSIDLKSGNDPASIIGILLFPGSVVDNRKIDNNFIINFNKYKYIIKYYISSEGIHAECNDATTKKKLSHYYYYLNYDIDSNHICK